MIIILCISQLNCLTEIAVYFLMTFYFNGIFQGKFLAVHNNLGSNLIGPVSGIFPYESIDELAVDLRGVEERVK